MIVEFRYQGWKIYYNYWKWIIGILRFIILPSIFLWIFENFHNEKKKKKKENVLLPWLRPISDDNGRTFYEE